MNPPPPVALASLSAAVDRWHVVTTEVPTRISLHRSGIAINTRLRMRSVEVHETTAILSRALATLGLKSIVRTVRDEIRSHTRRRRRSGASPPDEAGRNGQRERRSPRCRAPGRGSASVREEQRIEHSGCGGSRFEVVRPIHGRGPATRVTPRARARSLHRSDDRRRELDRHDHRRLFQHFSPEVGAVRGASPPPSRFQREDQHPHRDHVRARRRGLRATRSASRTARLYEWPSGNARVSQSLRARSSCETTSGRRRVDDRVRDVHEQLGYTTPSQRRRGAILTTRGPRF